MYFDYRLWQFTEGMRGRMAGGVLLGLLALGAGIARYVFLGQMLAAVFAVLGVLPLVVLAQLGVIVCIGVLLDTLVVRTMLVPSLALVLGEKFWWPRRIERRAARV